MEKKKTPILVSGSHRSGSTWLGQMINLSNEAGYIHEPFHRKYGISGKLFDKWFIYVNDENESRYIKALEKFIAFKYPIRNKFNEAETIQDYGRSVRDFTIFLWNRLNQKRPLIKDPIAIFSAEWLYRTFDMDVVILIRHPAAFVGSIKKAEWRSGMNNFLAQPLLMRDYLSDFEQEILEHAGHQKDFIDEGILLWNMIHSVIKEYRKKHDDWFFIRHEDLSLNPIDKFRDIYDFLNLDYTESIKTKITNFSTETDDPGKLKRDSKSNIWSWKNRLTQKEIDRVYEGTCKIASGFYSNEDW